MTAEPSEDHSPAGTFCFVTGNNSSNASLSRVAGGRTTLISPVLDLSSVPDPRIVFWRWYYHNAPVGATAGASQPFLTEISNDGGTSWTEASRLQRERGAWDRVEIRVTDFFAAPALVRVQFTAQNRLPGTIVEAGIDDFEYYAGGAMVASPGGSASRSRVPRPCDTRHRRARIRNRVPPGGGTAGHGGRGDPRCSRTPGRHGASRYARIRYAPTDLGRSVRSRRPDRLGVTSSAPCRVAPRRTTSSCCCGESERRRSGSGFYPGYGGTDSDRGARDGKSVVKPCTGLPEARVDRRLATCTYP